ncbi:hypothetical protein SNEBB_000606 [Seison nebaliae]|nr:hypothetical protein SNEBB_000606 [Seison nebaliae]
MIENRSLTQIYRLALATFGVELCYAAETVFVSPKLLELGLPRNIIPLIWLIPPSIGIILAPILGFYSDISSSKFGRRRIVIICLSLIILLGITLVVISNKINGTTNFPFKITLLIIGIVIMDCCTDCLLSPIRSYLSDVLNLNDQVKGLTALSSLAGFGGVIGYMISGIPWWRLIAHKNNVESFLEKSTNISNSTITYNLSDQMNFVYCLTFVLFMISILISITTAEEENNGEQLLQFSFKLLLIQLSHLSSNFKLLCVAHCCCWMSFVAFSLYFTDFTAEEIFGGSPYDESTSEIYSKGVRIASYMMLLYPLSCWFYSNFLPILINKYGIHNSYLFGISIYLIGLVLLLLTKHVIGATFMCITAGVMYSTMMFIPFNILNNYQQNDIDEYEDETLLIGMNAVENNSGFKISILTSMMYIAQISISLLLYCFQSKRRKKCELTEYHIKDFVLPDDAYGIVGFVTELNPDKCSAHCHEKGTNLRLQNCDGYILDKLNEECLLIHLDKKVSRSLEGAPRPYTLSHLLNINDFDMVTKLDSCDKDSPVQCYQLDQTLSNNDLKKYSSEQIKSIPMAETDDDAYCERLCRSTKDCSDYYVVHEYIPLSGTETKGRYINFSVIVNYIQKNVIVVHKHKRHVLSLQTELSTAAKIQDEFCLLGTRCAGNPCGSHGTCLPLTIDSPAFRCKCDLCYRGTLCEDLDGRNDQCKCMDTSCYHGTCVDPPTNSKKLMTVKCLCDKCWVGPRCSERDTSNPECSCMSSSGTCVHGQCIETLHGTKCQCMAGWAGENCSLLVDYCSSLPCLNGGTCHNSPDGWTCQCRAPYTGKVCAVAINVCTSHPCINGGVCQSLNGGIKFICQCPMPYRGKFCEKRINYCAVPQCANGGVCNEKAIFPFFKCLCPPTWYGRHCEYAKDPCHAQPCVNGGTCVRIGGSSGYRCFCLPSYSGTHCQVHLDACQSFPCKNGGTCFNQNDGAAFFCMCPLGYQGRMCETKIDVCLHTPCMSGTCHTLMNGDFTCLCPADRGGKYCQHLLNLCQPTPCTHGVCKTTPVGPSCQCKWPFTGRFCDKLISACRFDDLGESRIDIPDLKRTPVSRLKCSNHGNCLDWYDLPKHNFSILRPWICDCDKGWKGASCEKRALPCESKPCLNRGKCSDVTNHDRLDENYVCQCSPGYTGKRCDKLITPCEIGTCHNDGKCHNINQVQFVCDCKPTWTGKYCQISLINCQPNACLPTMKCVNEPNSEYGYVCDRVTKSLAPQVSKMGAFSAVSIGITILFVLVLLLCCAAYQRPDLIAKGDIFQTRSI